MFRHLNDIDRDSSPIQQYIYWSLTVECLKCSDSGMAPWTCIPLLSKSPWRRHCSAETCRGLILVMNCVLWLVFCCILMSAFVGWFTECKNTMDCLSNMRGRQCMCNVTVRCVRATIVAVEKQWVLHILSVCFLALGIQHAISMRRIAICDLPHSETFFHIIL